MNIPTKLKTCTLSHLEALAEKKLLLSKQRRAELMAASEGVLPAGSKPRSVKQCLETFFSKIKQGNENECWEWTGAVINEKRKMFYGSAFVCGHTFRAHRLAYRLYNGMFDESLFICHKCDNPKCCNPGHLFLGTAKDNYYDCMGKGRNTRGDKHGGSLLKEIDVKNIRKEFELGDTKKELSKKYKVPYRIIFRIIKRETWKHIN